MISKILYVEDDILESEVIERLFHMVQKKFHGEVEFKSVNSWNSGVETVYAFQPDVVLLDLALSAIGTIPSDTATTLQELSKHADKWPPVIVLTGNKYDLELRRKCIMAGASDFMLKDQAHRDPELLCERIYHAYLRREARDARA